MKVLALAVTFGLSLAMASCGYQPVHGGASAEHLSVVLSESKVPDAVASDEVLAGLREELARTGALTSGASYPRCEVEILRLDEAAEGIAAAPGADGQLTPQARGTRVGPEGRRRGAGARHRGRPRLRNRRHCGRCARRNLPPFRRDASCRTAPRKAPRIANHGLPEPERGLSCEALACAKVAPS
jgi:hypothetical protein